MGPYRGFIILMSVMGLLLALAVALLLIRDRRTLRLEMSARARRNAIARNSAQTLHWWHVAGLAAIINALMVDHMPPQRAWVLVLHAVITALCVIGYYLVRYRVIRRLPRHSAEQIEQAPASNGPPPIQ